MGIIDNIFHIARKIFTETIFGWLIVEKTKTAWLILTPIKFIIWWFIYCYSLLAVVYLGEKKYGIILHIISYLILYSVIGGFLMTVWWKLGFFTGLFITLVAHIKFLNIAKEEDLKSKAEYERNHPKK